MSKFKGWLAAGIFGACIVLFVLQGAAWIDSLEDGVADQHRSQLSQIVAEVDR